jgi:hypothetical protein
MAFHDDEEKEKEDGAISEDAIGEVLEESDEDEDDDDPLGVEEEEKGWE